MDETIQIAFKESIDYINELTGIVNKKVCRHCKNHELKASTIDKHRICYAHYCKKFGAFGDSFVELYKDAGCKNK